MTTMADAVRPAFARGGPGSPRAAIAGTSHAAAAGWWVASTGYDLALIAAGSLIIALSAQAAIPLPFSPVPVTGQTLAVLLVGSLLGRARGSAAVAAYLGEGAAGLPVFAGGAAGPQALLGPTGGYLAGFLVGAWVCGALAERGWDRRAGTTVGSMVLGNLAIFALGVPWLARVVGAERALALGFWPFLAGDVVKIGAAAALLPLGWRWIHGREP
jgi:biotin transport system substrate-specific component